MLRARTAWPKWPRLRPELDIIVNVQGDEPLIDPRAIDQVIEPLLSGDGRNVHPGLSAQKAGRNRKPPSGQSRLRRKRRRALLQPSAYPLSSEMPCPSQTPSKVSASRRLEVGDSTYLGHAGLYVYRRETLLAHSQHCPRASWKTWKSWSNCGLLKTALPSKSLSSTAPFARRPSIFPKMLH